MTERTTTPKRNSILKKTSNTTTPEPRRVIAPLRAAETTINESFHTLQPQIAENLREFSKKPTYSVPDI